MIQQNINSTYKAFLMLAVYWILYTGLSSDHLFKVVITTFLFLSVFYFLAEVRLIIRFTPHDRFNHWWVKIIYLYFVWCLFTVIRGLSLNSQDFLTLVSNPGLGGIVWLMPLFLFVGLNKDVISDLRKVGFIFSLLSMPFCLYSIYEVIFLNSTQPLSFGKVGNLFTCGTTFLLLTGMARGWQFLLCALSLLISIISHFYLGERTHVLILTAVFVYSIFTIGVDKTNSLRFRGIFLLCLLLLGGLVFGDKIYNLDDELLADTRTFLLEELSEDFDLKDWVIGRGALGVYYSPFFESIYLTQDDGDWMFRPTNEIGYLHLVLKSGLIGVGGYLFVFILAFTKAIFSKDRFVFGVSIVIIIHIVEMFVVGRLNFIPERVFYWILAGWVLFESNKGWDHEGNSSYSRL